VVQIIAIVKPFRAEAVLEALAALGVEDCVVREARGYGRQKGYLRHYVQAEASPTFVPKVEISCWVSDAKVSAAVEKIVAAARTGRIGDGKVFVLRAVDLFETSVPEGGDS
jgi:nitrogen regulatory protein PII